MKFARSVLRSRLSRWRHLQAVAALVLAVTFIGHDEARAVDAIVVARADLSPSLVAPVASPRAYKASRSGKRYVTKKTKAKGKSVKKRYAKKKNAKKQYAKKQPGKPTATTPVASKPYVVASVANVGRPPLPVAKKVAAPEVKVAALGNIATDLTPEKPKSLTGGGVRWIASSSCLAASLRAKVYTIASNYGNVTVNSTCRSKSHNRRVGGARRSQHLTGNAVDFRVHGNWRAAAAYLRSHHGGYKHYGGGRFHIDAGPRRRW